MSLASFSLLHYNSQNWPSDLVPEGINDKWRTAVPWPSESQRLPPCVGHTLPVWGTDSVCLTPPRPDSPDSALRSLGPATMPEATAQTFPDTVEQREAFNCLGNLGVPQMRN